MYALVVLYLIEKIYEIPYEHPLIPRLILLLLSSLTLIGLIWLIKPRRPTIDQKWGRGWKWVGVVARIGMVLLVVSLLANIFGFVGLSSLLTSAFLKSIYLAVAFLTAVIVLDGLFSILLRARPLQTLHMVRVDSEVVKNGFKRILIITAYIIWFLWTLANFNLYQPISNWMLEILSERWTVGTFAISLNDILAFLVAIWLSLKISKFIRFVLDEDVFPRIKLPRGVPGSISMLVHYMILAFGFIIAMAAAGIEWSRFAILAGALGVGIGFGLQNVVNNFVSGLVLIFERPIKVGDTIEVGTLIGTVKRIGIRSSTVRTFTGAEIIVPNGNLISNEVVNWTLSDRLRRIDIPIGVAYGTDPKRVVKILNNLAVNNKDVLNKPEPLVLFQGFGESSLDFELRFWTDNFTTWMALKSEITLQVEEAIKKAKIEIPFPQRDLHVRSVDPKVIEAGNGKQGS
jgi:small-conductance mechanosensitive channel